jgi:glycosyltransferase involved in cell wall biosynthesis
LGIKLISHVNGDSDIIEAWLNHYLRLGVEHFHLVLHGPAQENQKLLAIKDSYPITIEDSYEGPFDSDQKKNRLDAILARCPNQWVLIADSDEFVEFPYNDIPETIGALRRAGANLMAAPMLQRITLDGSFGSPAIIEDPFKTFPLCSSALYWKVGLKAEIFKFPLFFCDSETRLLEEGNHNPPLGSEPREARILGVTHHFKFRRTLSERLGRRINSDHQFRQESLELREYLDAHSDRLPLDDSFLYSRAELFRRGLLKHVSTPECGEQELLVQSRPSADTSNDTSPAPSERKKLTDPAPREVPAKSATMFVIPPSTQNEDFSSYVAGTLRELHRSGERLVVISFDPEFQIRDDQGTFPAQELQVQYRSVPKSFWDWLKLIRFERPAKVVFCYNWLEAFPWRVGFAAWLAGVHRRFAIQYGMPLAVLPPVKAKSLSNLARRLFGARTRRLVRIRVSAFPWNKTICTSNALRDALKSEYRFAPNRTLSLHEGVSTSEFKPCKFAAAEVRSRLGINPDEFVLLCTAQFTAEKGIDVLIHALSRVLRQGIQCKCILTGSGPLREQQVKKANSLGLFNFVFFERPRDDVRPYLQAASAFILPSFWENLPASVLRAMACGLPCIVGDVGGLTEVVKGKLAGIVLPEDSVDAIQSAIEYLATRPCERVEMGKRAREIVCRDFEINDRIADLKTVLAD